ncbi:MAG: galactose mutarotase [Planctomycetes bacterium]|nr:galactose mutarotase [Planctomycetota bacterium]
MRPVLVGLALPLITLASCTQQMTANTIEIKRENFQVEHDGKPVDLFTIKNAKGMTVQLTNYGGKIVSIIVADRDGKLGDVNLGYESAEAYINGTASLGATIGRYANRIAGGQFELNGQVYKLFKNNGPNTLHGGKKGYRFVVWEGRQIDDASVELSYLSRDGEEGFPGNLLVKVVYSVTDKNELRLEYSATTDKPTVLNLTNHAFFNLRGEGQGDVLDHVLWVNASRFLPTDETGIPTGERRNVQGTPFDFMSPKSLGRDIHQANVQLTVGRGYDHNFILNDSDGELTLAARLSEATTGRIMEVYTTEPGLQVYTGNFLTGEGTDIGKGGKAYGPRSALCLESQHFPDSPNQPEFPSTVLNPGEVFRSTTVYRFSAE